MEAFNAALEVLEKAMDYSHQMLEQRSIRRLEYETNKLVMGPEYWVLYTNMRKAEEAYDAAEQAVLDATKKANEAEAAYEDAKVAELAAEKALDEAEDAQYRKEWMEWCMTHKCIFCGELDSECDGDHSEEMGYLSRESERRY